MKSRFFVLNTLELLSCYNLGSAKMLRRPKCEWCASDILRYVNGIICGLPIFVTTTAYNTNDNIGFFIFKDGNNSRSQEKPIVIHNEDAIMAFLIVFCPWYYGDTNFAFVYSFKDKTIRLNRDTVACNRDEISCSCLLDTVEYLREKNRIDKQYWDEASKLCVLVRELVFPFCAIRDDDNIGFSEAEIKDLRNLMIDRYMVFEKND